MKSLLSWGACLGLLGRAPYGARGLKLTKFFLRLLPHMVAPRMGRVD